MTPFQEFRLWLRRAPTNERLSAAIASAVVMVLLIWVLVPSNDGSPNSAAAFSTGQAQTGQVGSGQGATGGSAADVPGAAGSGAGASDAQMGSARPGSPAGSGAAGGAGGVAPTAGGAGSAAGAASACPAGGAVGVTSKQIKVAVLIVAIAGAAANSTFGVASAADQKRYYQAVIGDLNARGGIACRKVVPEFFQANPADKQSLQQTCLDVVSAKVFAVLDPGAYAQFPLMGCYAQHKVPYFGGYLMAQSLGRQFFPYLFEFNTLDQLYRSTIFGLKAKGFFAASHGFKKLGFVYRSCYKDVINKMLGWFNQAGVPSSAISTYDLGCPDTFASESDVQQAVYQFKRDGVTNVTGALVVADLPAFTRDAKTQLASWKYGLADDEMISLSYGTSHPDYDQIDGAIAVTSGRNAEERTPGIKPTAATARCDAIFAKAGLKPVYQQPDAAGNACDQVWMFAAAAGHAPVLQGSALAAGLQAARSVEFSFPQGPNDFSANGVTTGGQFYRFAAFTKACNCWRLTDPTFRRGPM